MTQEIRQRRARKQKKNNIIYLFLVLASALLAVFLAFKLYLYSLPPISNFDSIKQNPVTTIYSSDGQIIKTFTTYKFEKVDNKRKEIMENMFLKIYKTSQKYG